MKHTLLPQTPANKTAPTKKPHKKKNKPWKTKYSIQFPCTGIICKRKSNLLSAALASSSNTCEYAMEHMANY